MSKYTRTGFDPAMLEQLGAAVSGAGNTANITGTGASAVTNAVATPGADANEELIKKIADAICANISETMKKLDNEIIENYKNKPIPIIADISPNLIADLQQKLADKFVDSLAFTEDDKTKFKTGLLNKIVNEFTGILDYIVTSEPDFFQKILKNELPISNGGKSKKNKQMHKHKQTKKINGGDSVTAFTNPLSSSMLIPQNDNEKTNSTTNFKEDIKHEPFTQQVSELLEGQPAKIMDKVNQLLKEKGHNVDAIVDAVVQINEPRIADIAKQMMDKYLIDNTIINNTLISELIANKMGHLLKDIDKELILKFHELYIKYRPNVIPSAPPEEKEEKVKTQLSSGGKNKNQTRKHKNLSKSK